ncbi:hypothetical protein STAFG_0137 [Streptomyces afghaniensis 772]|uniref:Uncharacterized protein n=1 Tax=Streptomyces afghaniensis 772 TaxID=1283301 RepID=S4MZU9_9ACTN|nr:hypothetical protein STAFG_0137 [Streptomyces afghaniensis 772]
MAPVIVYLASKESAHVTGQAIAAGATGSPVDAPR